LSARYGWTPKQIRELDLEDVLQYLEIIAEINRIEKIRSMKNK
jgi:hypothetical protein